MPVPNQTMIRGAKADLGREFRITKKGSSTLAVFGEEISKIEHNTEKKVTARKLTRVYNSAWAAKKEAINPA